MRRQAGYWGCSRTWLNRPGSGTECSAHDLSSRRHPAVHPQLGGVRRAARPDAPSRGRQRHERGRGPFARYAARLPGNASAMVTFFALLFGSLTAFAISRMRIRHGWLVSNAALLTYVIPASFLAIPFYRIMQNYGLANNLWSVIAALVAFATPYAIFVFQEYGRSIPIEVDESARIDGASPPQIYLRIYLPLMAPALVAVGTYALLLAWNEYLYQFPLLSSTANIYAAPPVAIYYAFRRRMTAGLTMGGVKG